MAANLSRTALILVLGLADLATLVGCAKPPDPGPGGIKLGKLPDLHLTDQPPITEAQVKKIKELIAGLAALDKPDFGLSATLSEEAFSRYPGQEQAGALILTKDHGLRRSENIRELVALGPDALPFLLDALDDQTPTKITVTHKKGDDGGMWHGSELLVNPVNPAEEAIAKEQAKAKRERNDHVSSYTIKVGDVCFVIIGQIVGRWYQAVRPSAGIVLNCPAEDAQLCAEVRSIWQSQDARAKLFDSLRSDYATEGVFNGKSLNGWSLGSYWQCSAAQRLLFYFPKESAQLVADRLDKLDVGKGLHSDSSMSRDVANGVVAEDFINSVAWSKDPAVRAALVRVFQRAEQYRSLLAALPAIEDKDLVHQRLESQIDALPADEDGPYGDGYYLLVTLTEQTPYRAKPIFERYLRDASYKRCHIVCLVLRKMKVDWDRDVLGALLNDKRFGLGWYQLRPGNDGPSRLIRVCDEAAVTLSQNHAELKFIQAGEHTDLDKQIAIIREQLARKK